MKPTRLISLFSIVCVALFTNGKCDYFDKGIKPFAKAKKAEDPICSIRRSILIDGKTTFQIKIKRRITMLRQKRSRIILALAYALALNGCAIVSANNGDQCLNFGDGIKIFTELEHFYSGDVIKSQLDLNGDGVNDRVVYLSIDRSAKLTSDVIATNPFEYGVEGYTKEDENLSDKRHLALGIIHSPTQTKPCERFVIYNNVYFKEWDGNSDIKVVRQLLELFPSWKEIRSEELKDIVRYDALGIIRFGLHILIFWNDKEYNVYQMEYEEP
jgi:hypothetical protein